jgi:hypothetical protein
MGSAGGEGLPPVFLRSCCPICSPAGDVGWRRLAKVTRQAGDQGLCGAEVRGFEPLASSVRESIGVVAQPVMLVGKGC